MAIVRAAEQEVHGEEGFEVRVLADSRRGAKELHVTRMKLAPGEREEGANLHKHDHEEIIVVLSGACSFRVGDEEPRLSAGDVLIIPPGVLHIGIREPEGCETLTIQLAGARNFGADGKERPVPPWRR